MNLKLFIKGSECEIQITLFLFCSNYLVFEYGVSSPGVGLMS